MSQNQIAEREGQDALAEQKAEKSAPTVDQLLEIAIRRAEDKKASTTRLNAATERAADRIGAVVAQTGLRVAVAIGENLMGEPDYEYPIPYLVEGAKNARIYVGRAEWGECGYSETSVDEKHEHSWKASKLGLIGAWEHPPRHIAVLLPSALRQLVEKLAARAEKLASETEAAVAEAEELGSLLEKLEQKEAGK